MNKPTASEQTMESLARWRLVLGKYSSKQIEQPLSLEQQRIAKALEQLYGQEYKERGVRQGKELGPGSLDPSQLNIPAWLGEIQELFPDDVCQRITQHALDRYGMTDLVRDPKTLQQLEPSTELLATVLSLKGMMDGAVLGEVRRLVRRVVEDIQRRLKHSIQRRLTGQRNRFQDSQVKSAANFDPVRTIRRNLKHYDPERKQLIVHRPLFSSRVQRHLPWEIILCVDQSGSMVDSLIHSAVLAGAIAELPAISVRLVVFDTSVVDLTEHVTDPVEVLMSVQLGGGTNIGKAMRYCHGMIQNPARTIVVLVTDFCEGASPQVLRQTVRAMKADGCKLIGLASLEKSSALWCDHEMASRLASDGMEIAAVTPNRLAEWLAEVMQDR